MTPTDFLTAAFAAAKAAGHLFPDWAACEAAATSHFGTTPAAAKANNLFDFRVPAKRGPGTLTVNVGDATKAAHRLSFASWEDCFKHRAQMLQVFTMFYLVKRAKTGEEYIAAMNKLAADPSTYGPKVKSIYTQNEALFQ